jgi:hypothetical protein
MACFQAAPVSHAAQCHFMLRCIYMEFLYRFRAVPLENICAKWQIIAGRELSRARLTQIKTGIAGGSQLTSCCIERSMTMLDAIMLAIGLGFFALAVGYTVACDRL